MVAEQRGHSVDTLLVKDSSPQVALRVQPRTPRAISGFRERGKEFEFDSGETRLFELPRSIFERRYFYRDLNSPKPGSPFLSIQVEFTSYLSERLTILRTSTSEAAALAANPDPRVE